MSGPQGWRAQAACRPGSGHDPDLWYPDPKDDATRVQAQRICAACPVKIDCFTEANTRGEPWGIWGGHDVNPDGNLAARPVGRPPKCGTGCGTPHGFKRHIKAGERACLPCRDAANEAYQRKYAKSLGRQNR